MKSRRISRLGRFLKSLSSLRIVIIDDEKAYFNDQMLSLARSIGYRQIDRYYTIDTELLQNLLQHPPEIVILDVKGVANPDVASDGFAVASQLHRHTPTFIVMTSAHKFHLKNAASVYDYVLENRLLTAVDFVEEIENIVSAYLETKARFFRHLSLRMGLKLARYSFTPVFSE